MVQDEKPFTITTPDVLDALRRNRKLIILGTCLLPALLIAFILTRPPKYKAEATFREKGKSQSENMRGFSLAALAGLNENNENTAQSLFRSRALLGAAILQNSKQAVIEQSGLQFSWPKNVYRNLQGEYANLLDKHYPILAENDKPVAVKDLKYAAEKVLKMQVSFLNETDFQITLPSKEILFGEVGKPVAHDHFTLTLTTNGNSRLAHQGFAITLLPLQVAYEQVKKQLFVQSDTRDKGLLRLTYKNPNRKEASAFLNSILAAYQEHQRKDHERICKEQIAYLHNRQEDAGNFLQQMMVKHAETMSAQGPTIDLLFQNQQNHVQKLLLIDLELNRLQNAFDEGRVFYDPNGWEGGSPSIINQILAEVRTSRQQADAIDIALRNQNLSIKDKPSFEEQLITIRELQACCEEAEEVRKELAQGKTHFKLKILGDHPKYRMEEWQRNLKKGVCSSGQCLQYVDHLIHLFEVEKKILEERLARQQTTLQEHQGIDLAAANQLFLEYSSRLNETEGEILHHQFLAEQIQAPDFEVSSLSTVLKDPVSHEIIQKASHANLLLQDQDNRSVRELERLKGELALQKGVLKTHIHQTRDLLLLKKKLLQEKIWGLQNTTLDLHQQKISVLNQQLQDYLLIRIANLKQEREVIEGQQGLLRKEMLKLPTQWASEKMIEQHLEMSKKMIEKIAEAVEAKNISAKLDLSQSAPLDGALTPLHPQSPLTLVFAFLGSIIGFLLSSSFVVARECVKGFPARKDNLQSVGQIYLGNLSSQLPEILTDGDLETLRRLAGQITNAHLVALLLNDGPNYAFKLAELLSKGGRKVAILSCIFNGKEGDNQIPGLQQYLKGEELQTQIRSDYLWISSGGMTRFGKEILDSPPFDELLKKLMKEWDCVLLISRCSPLSAEGEKLFSLADRTVVTLKGETLHELSTFFPKSPLFLGA